MPPPLIVLCMPGVAFFLLIQMLLCQAFNFNVSITKQKRYAKPLSDNEDELSDEKEPSSDAKISRDLDLPEEVKPQERDMSDESSNSENSENESVMPEHSIDESPQPRSNSTTADSRRSRRKSVFAESYDPSKDDEEYKVIHSKTEDEKQWLIDNLGNITLFQHLAKDQLVTVVDAMLRFPVREGDVIMKQGDKGNTFYVIQTGVYNVFVTDDDGDEKLMHTYDNEGSFGELALLYNQPRAATIEAKTDGVLWIVDGQTFRRIVYKITYQKRLMYENLINNVPILKFLEPFERANLVDALTPMTFQKDDQIIKQGEEGDGMYFVVSGGVRIVMITADETEVFLKKCGNGDYFGELALITKKKRAASAYADEITNLAFLDRDAFERLLGPCMDVMRRNIDSYDELFSNLMQEDTN